MNVIDLNSDKTVHLTTVSLHERAEEDSIFSFTNNEKQSSHKNKQFASSRITYFDGLFERSVFSLVGASEVDGYWIYGARFVD